MRPWYHTYLDSTTDHMDSTLLLETLQDELKLFNETAKKQMEELQVRGRHHPKAKLPFLTTIGGSLEDSFIYLFIHF